MASALRYPCVETITQMQPPREVVYNTVMRYGVPLCDMATDAASPLPVQSMFHVPDVPAAEPEAPTNLFNRDKSAHSPEG